MTIRHRPFDLDIADLASRLDLALTFPSRLGHQTRPEGEMFLVDPLPFYAVHGNEFAGGPAGLGQSGWKALVLADEAHPLAAVDIFPPGAQRDSVTYAIHGHGQARSLLNSLLEAETLPLTGDHEARFIEFPALALSALWLAGEDDVFIVCHDGPAPRPGDARIDRQGLMAMVAERAKGRSVS